ncbi:MAG TPA: dienelactone hydrolase family protein [Rhizomicrobium sp.]|nr:dienelactone hydrolase family protein [Rhizomicrobium sp.]
MSPRGKMVQMKMADGAEIGVYQVQPKGARRGGLVLIQEIFGVTEHIKELSDGYADDGYEVWAPALYDREAPGLQEEYTPEGVQKCIKIARGEHPFQLSIDDTQVCINGLKGKGPVFITGYCYGGSVTWAAACKCDGLAAASGYYGGNIGQMADWQPKCPTILHFGEHDHGIPMDVVNKVKELHPDVPVYIYDAGHGFNSDRRSDYNEAAAKLGKQRTLDLFSANGG